MQSYQKKKKKKAGSHGKTDLKFMKLSQKLAPRQPVRPWRVAPHALMCPAG